MASTEARQRQRNGEWPLLLVCLPILAYLLLPTTIVLPMALTKSEFIQFPPQGLSLHSFSDYLHDPAWIASTLTSLKVAALAVGIATIVGTSAAIALHRTSFPGKGVVVGLILVPIVAPLIVLALAYYQFFDRMQMLGSWVPIALAHSVLVTPYPFITVQAGLAGLDPAQVRSAQSLGAGRLNVFRHVYWPIVRSAVLAGAIIAFAVSFDEVVISYFLQSPTATTLPVQMFTSLQFDLTPKIAAVSSLLLGLAAVVLVAQAAVVLRRRSRQEFGTADGSISEAPSYA